MRRFTVQCQTAVRTIAHRPALVAIILALVSGIAISILTPPEMGGDERDHFTRAYQISTGSLFTHRKGDAYGAYLPQSFVAEESRLAHLSFQDSDRTAFLSDLGRNPRGGPLVFVSARNAASYGPGSYIDYAVAIAFGRFLGLSTLVLLYLARLAGVITYAVILSLAVRRIPIRPWVLVCVGLLPTAVSQASTVSADGLTMVLSFLLVAEALRLNHDESAPRRRLIIESAVATGVLALAKPPYVLVVLLFAVPAWRYRRALARPLLAIGVEALVLAGAWGFYQIGHSPSQGNARFWLVVAPNQYAFHGIQAGAQTAYVITHPFAFLAAVGRTFSFAGSAFPKQLFGMLPLYQLPWALVLAAAAFLLAGCLLPESIPPRTYAIERVALITVSVAVILAVFAIAYTSWNAYRAPRIDAVNTRYLLPVLPALLIGVLPDQISGRQLSRTTIPQYLIIGLAAFVLTASIVGMHHRQYSPPSFAPARPLTSDLVDGAQAYISHGGVTLRGSLVEPPHYLAAVSR
jgi:uncharacterized membrane protein